jgi:hypothetical protein
LFDLGVCRDRRVVGVFVRFRAPFPMAGCVL